MHLDEMDRAHKRDHDAQDWMRDLRTMIDAYTANPPAKTSPGTLKALQLASQGLTVDIHHIDAIWD